VDRVSTSAGASAFTRGSRAGGGAMSLSAELDRDLGARSRHLVGVALMHGQSAPAEPVAECGKRGTRTTGTHWREARRPPSGDFLKRCSVPHAHRAPNGQTCANTSDQPVALTLAESHLLYRVTDR
jgi:hypothetical protein